MRVFISNEGKSLAFVLTIENEQIPVKPGQKIDIDDSKIKALPGVLKVSKYFEKSIAKPAIKKVDVKPAEIKVEEKPSQKKVAEPKVEPKTGVKTTTRRTKNTPKKEAEKENK